MYIPKSWLRNSDNEKRIRELLEVLENDFIDEELAKKQEEAIKEIEELGEDVILQKLKDGIFSQV